MFWNVGQALAYASRVPITLQSGGRFQCISPKPIAAPVWGPQLPHEFMPECLQVTALSCITYDTWPCVQEVVAPFVLENLGCSGDEARLLDCPVFDSDTATPALDYSGYDYFRDYTNSDICDPTAAGGGTFARVACGTSSSAGLRHLSVLHTALRRIFVNTLSMALECCAHQEW